MIACFQFKVSRKHALSVEQFNAMRQKRSEGTKIIDLMHEFKISKASVYRHLVCTPHAH